MRHIGERLAAERGRLELSQTALGEACGVGKRSQQNYESGERLPDAAYLAALAAQGADVLYVITGKRTGPAPVTLTAEEQTMLGYFREASKEVRRAALGALLGAAQGPGPQVQVGGANSQHSTGAGALNIGSFGETPAPKRRK